MQLQQLGGLLVSHAKQGLAGTARLGPAGGADEHGEGWTPAGCQKLSGVDADDGVPLAVAGFGNLLQHDLALLPEVDGGAVDEAQP